jgi:hypothetical protein
MSPEIGPINFGPSRSQLQIYQSQLPKLKSSVFGACLCMQLGLPSHVTGVGIYRLNDRPHLVGDTMSLKTASAFSSNILRHGVRATLGAMVSIAALGSPFLANAEVLGTTTNVVRQLSSGTLVVDLNGPSKAGTDLSFKTAAANTRVVVFFNAECAMAGSLFNWVDINILIDGVVIFPTTDDNALCAGNGTTNGDPIGSWVGASVSGNRIIPGAGTHTVRVVATSAGGTLFRLDDISTIVMR